MNDNDAPLPENPSGREPWNKAARASPKTEPRVINQDQAAARWAHARPRLRKLRSMLQRNVPRQRCRLLASSQR
jgi:hypothetical protein